MAKCKPNLGKPCPRTSTKPSSDETTPQPNDDDTTVIALGVVAAIGVLVLAVILGIIIYRRMRSQKPKTNLEPPVPIQNLSGSLENKYSDMDELHSGKCIGNHSEVEYSSCQENDKTDNIYNRIDEGSSRRSCDYDKAIFTDRQVDKERNDNSPGGDTYNTLNNMVEDENTDDYDKAILTDIQVDTERNEHTPGDDTYNTLNNMVEDENTDDYAHAKVVSSLQESSIEEGTVGQDNDDYDRLSHRPNNTAGNSSENDYDHMVNGEILSSSL